MIANFHLKNFKSWKDTGDINFAPITGFFGTNSSGKTSILQAILMLKQTVESADRKRVLHTGDDKSYVDLGTYYDVIHKHEKGEELSISLTWNTKNDLWFPDSDTRRETWSRSRRILRHPKINLAPTKLQLPQPQSLPVT